VVSVAIAAVIVPRIATGATAGDERVLVTAQSRAYEVALGLALPAAVAFALLANPIAGGLFERGAFGAQDTVAVAAALAAISAGLPGHVLEKVFGAVSFAHEDTKTPMFAALCGLVAAIIGGVLLFPHYGHTGAATAFAASGWVGAAVLGTILARRGWLRLDQEARRRLPRIAAATVAMGLVIGFGALAVPRIFPAAEGSSIGRLAMLLPLVLLGLVTYGAALHALSVAKLREIASEIRSRA